MHDSPYQPPVAPIEVLENERKILFPSFCWAVAKWEYWLVPALVAFFGVLTASSVEIEMQRRAVPAQNPIVRNMLINYGLWVSAAASLATFSIVLILLTIARSAYIRVTESSRNSAN